MLSFEASKKVVKGSKKLKYAWKIYLDPPRLPSWERTNHVGARSRSAWGPH